ncbi:uncharacterized protein [Henckelia pumila]|uniref:uncharacterized protein n=1 Tax=Henckelia pumila TaxID=405737 RepID=UPI003C6E39FA
MTPNELNYSPIEKLCLALIFVIQKLKHYFQAHTVRLVSKANPLKYVMSRPVLSDRLARWYLQLQQFEIIYVPQKAVKGQALADFLADHPIPADWELSNEFSDEDVLVIEVKPPWKMYFDGASNKEGAGAGVIFVTSDGEVLPYSFTLTQNCSNNVAEYQALILGLKMAVDIKQLHLQVYGDSALVINQLLGSYEVRKPELLPYHNYARKLMGWLGDVEIEHVPRKDNKQADALAKLASTISMPNNEARVPIYKNWVVPPLFEDESDEEKEDDNYTVEVFEIEKEDWRQAFVDYLKYEKLPNDPRQREMKKPAEQWKKLILKFAEPINQIMGNLFATLLLISSAKKFGFKQRKSSMYYAAANGLAEAFNKILCNLLKKIIAKSKKDWHERIGEALWAYGTTYRTPTQATPYALVYGVEAVVPLEQQIPSLRIAIQEGLTEEENAHLRLEELEALDEKRLEAQQRLECYQARLSRAFNKKVRSRSFEVGDLVLAVRRPIITTHRTENKFTSKWDGPYVVKEVYTNGAYKLVAEDGLRIGPINGKFLKRYYA